METVLKVAITAVVFCLIYYQFVFLRGLWRSQVDPKATINRVLERLKPQSDVIATRDPEKVYQSGKPVGDIIGPVIQEGRRLLFKQLSNTSTLRPDQPVEYQRLRLMVVSVGSRKGIMFKKTEAGAPSPVTDVLEDVVCEIIR